MSLEGKSLNITSQCLKLSFAINSSKFLEISSQLHTSRVYRFCGFALSSEVS